MTNLLTLPGPRCNDGSLDMRYKENRGLSKHGDVQFIIHLHFPCLLWFAIVLYIWYRWLRPKATDQAPVAPPAVRTEIIVQIPPNQDNERGQN